LLRDAETSARLTVKSPRLVELRNGIKFSQVEVICDGTEYGIFAYDTEAVELYELAREYERRIVAPLVV
jgi:hypothetical protein